MRDTVDILGVNVNIIDMKQNLEIIDEFLKSNSTKIIFTPNSEMIMAAKNDSNLKNVLNKSDLLLADGIGVVLASKILGKRIPERVTGYDTTINLFKLGINGTLSFYLLGGKPGIAQKAKQNLEATYSGINIVGYHHGYFDKNKEKLIIEEINRLKPDILLVGLGAPKQEHWIYNNKDKLNTKICMGIGGSFDVIAGVSKRAPIFFQKYGLEWLYRFIKQPCRYKRMFKLPQFALNVLYSKLNKKR